MSSSLLGNNVRIRRTTALDLCLGQLVSFNLAITSFSASLVTTRVDAPLTLSFFTYLVLTLVYGSIMLYRRQKLMVSWYWYLILGFVDVHGNYLVNKAFEFTSITSVTLLDCWTVAFAMILTWYFLGTRYSFRQFIGAIICVAGLCLVLLSDSGVSGGGGSQPLLGDVMVITGSFFFSISNVGEEFCVKMKDRTEVVAMIGLFGMLVSAAEILVLETKTLESTQWSAELVAEFATYAVASFGFYTLVPYVLKISGATLFNLSLLTSDMWAVLVRIFIYKQNVDWLYYLAFAVFILGIFIYSKVDHDETSNDAPRIESSSDSVPTSYHLIDENSTTQGDNYSRI